MDLRTLKRTLWIGGICLGLLAVTGCAGKSLKELMGKKAPPTEYYIDAPRGFAIEHPQSWPDPDYRQGPAQVAWRLAAEKSEEPAVLVSITILQPQQAVGGFDPLLESFYQQHPNFELTGRQAVDLAAAPAQRLTGYTPTRSYLVVLITARRGAFILSFSTPPESFQETLPTFEGMVESFRIVD